jgi:SRSO17 transposase
MCCISCVRRGRRGCGWNGELRVHIAHRRVWAWDGEEKAYQCWHLIVGREVKSERTIKYTLFSAGTDTPVLRLAQMQRKRYWIERAFEDARGECGLADYQELGWRSWHHHVTIWRFGMSASCGRQARARAVNETPAW